MALSILNHESYWGSRLQFTNNDWNALVKLLPSSARIENAQRFRIESASHGLIHEVHFITQKSEIRSYERIITLITMLRDKMTDTVDEANDEDLRIYEINEWSKTLLSIYHDRIDAVKSRPPRTRSANDIALAGVVEALIDLWVRGDGKLAFSTRFDPKSGKQQLSGPLARFLKAGLTPLYAAAKWRMPSDTQLIYLLRKMRRERKR